MADAALFPYSPIKNALGETAWRPILPLMLTYREHSNEFAGLVDTGADVNVLPYRMGLELGAVWEEQGRVLELSGNLAQFEARGIILLAHIAPFSSPVQLAFAWTRADHIPLILGQVNFFREFQVCFFGFRREFEVRLRS